jgi:hypothetical protein
MLTLLCTSSIFGSGANSLLLAMLKRQELFQTKAGWQGRLYFRKI